MVKVQNGEVFISEEDEKELEVSRLVLKAFKQEYLDDALKYIKEAIKIAPDNGDIWYHKGLLDAENEDFLGAIKSFEKARELGLVTSKLEEDCNNNIDVTKKLIEEGTPILI